MQIHWAQFPELSSPQADAEKRIERLAAGHDDIIDVRIVAQPTNHHRRGGQSVKLNCLVRGSQVVASSESGDLARALAAVVDDLERQIHELRERRREPRKQAQKDAARAAR